MQERIKACFTESIQTQIAAAEALPDAISRAAMTLVQSLLNGNKILCCGNGTSAANAQHFAASMINRFETERPSLPAIALNTCRQCAWTHRAQRLASAFSTSATFLEFVCRKGAQS